MKHRILRALAFACALAFALPAAAQTVEQIPGNLGAVVNSLLRGSGAKTPTVRIVGDSRGANHLSALLYSVRGPFNWARYELNQRFEMDPEWITAISGTQIAVDNGNGVSESRQLDAVLAVNPKPGFIWLSADVNDITQGRTSDQMIADKMVNINKALAAGVTPIVFTSVTPTIWNATQRQYGRNYNAFVRSLASEPRIIMIDAAERVLDWTSATSQPLGSGATGKLYDTTHYGPGAAEPIGHDLAVAMDRFLPVARWHGMSSPEDVYDATLAPRANMLGANAAFRTTGGANTDSANNAGSASTGNVALGARLYKANGQAIGVVGAVQAGVVSLNGVDVPVNVQNIKITSGGAGKQTVTFLLPDVTTVAPGDRNNIAAWINVKSATGLYGAGLSFSELNAGGTFIQTYGDMIGWNNGGVWSFLNSSPKKGFQKSGVMTLSADAAKLRSSVIMDVDGATANVEIEVAVPAVRKLNFLLERDLRPASNDNGPVFMEKVG